MKTFYLGVGAQKAGTSWLFNQLKFRKKGFISCAKEMHTFDVAWLPNHISNKEWFRTHPDVKTQDIRNKLMDNPKQYFNYFCYLMGDDYNSSGDFTPEYANLEKHHFEYIKQEFENRGVKVKVVFLMREPVSRLKSMIKMRKRNNPNIEIDLFKLVAKHNGGGDSNYSNYKKTIETIESVFDKQDIFYAFYELLFQQEDRIARFFDISVSDINTHETYNTSSETQTIKFSKEQIKMLKSHYKTQYDFIKERFNFEWVVKK